MLNVNKEHAEGELMNDSIINIKYSRRNIYDIILTTILISAGINLIIMGVGNIIGIEGNIYFIIMGALLVACSLVLTYCKNFKQSNRKYIINAVVTYDAQKKCLVNIRNYDFMEDLDMYMLSAIGEDHNIKAMWEKDRLGMEQIFNQIDNKASFVGVSRSGAILNQLIEYLIMKKLQLVTSAYFNKPHFQRKKINVVERSDISDFVANNIFINLFSKPTYERIAFDNKEMEKNVIYCYGKNNAIYDKFELNLPKKCKIFRKNNEILIKHSFFELRLIPAFTGFSENLPNGFIHKYMKYEEKINCFKVWIGIELKFTWKAFLINKIQYYEWIDEYISELNEYASFDKFLKRIQWELANTILSYM